MYNHPTVTKRYQIHNQQQQYGNNHGKGAMKSSSSEEQREEPSAIAKKRRSNRPRGCRGGGSRRARRERRELEKKQLLQQQQQQQQPYSSYIDDQSSYHQSQHQNPQRYIQQDSYQHDHHYHPSGLIPVGQSSSLANLAKVYAVKHQPVPLPALEPSSSFSSSGNSSTEDPHLQMYPNTMPEGATFMSALPAVDPKMVSILKRREEERLAASKPLTLDILPPPSRANRQAIEMDSRAGSSNHSGRSGSSHGSNRNNGESGAMSLLPPTTTSSSHNNDNNMDRSMMPPPPARSRTGGTSDFALLPPVSTATTTPTRSDLSKSLDRVLPPSSFPDTSSHHGHSVVSTNNTAINTHKSRMASITNIMPTASVIGMETNAVVSHHQSSSSSKQTRSKLAAIGPPPSTSTRMQDKLPSLNTTQSAIEKQRNTLAHGGSLFLTSRRTFLTGGRLTPEDYMASSSGPFVENMSTFGQNPQPYYRNVGGGWESSTSTSSSSSHAMVGVGYHHNKQQQQQSSRQPSGHNLFF